MAFQITQAPKMTMGMPDLIAAIIQGQQIPQNYANLQQSQLANQKSQTLMPFVQPQAEAELTKAQQYNQYYPQDIQSQVNSRNSATDLSKLKVKYPGLGESGIVGELAFANLLKDTPDIMQRFSSMNPQNQQQQPNSLQSQGQNQPGNQQGLTQSMMPVIAKNQGMQQNGKGFDPSNLLLQNIQSEMNARNSLANWRNGGMGNMRYAPAIQKNIYAFGQQLAVEHPEWDNDTLQQAQSAYLMGAEAVNGNKLPALSGTASALRQAIFKQNSTAQIQNQAAAMDTTAQEFNSIAIEPLAKFSGLKGKIDIAGYKAMMASGHGDEVPQDARDYISYQNTISNFAMDTLRKGFGTSVVPGYVYATLGNAANPGSAWWSDSKQVYNDMKRVNEWLNKNADIYKRKAEQGATARSNEFSKSINNKDPKLMTTEEIKAELSNLGGSNV